MGNGVGTYEGPGAWRPVSHTPSNNEGPGAWRPVSQTPSNNLRTSSSIDRSMRPAGYVPSNNMRQSSVQRLPSFGMNAQGSYSIASAARFAVSVGYPQQQPQQQFQ